MKSILAAFVIFAGLSSCATCLPEETAAGSKEVDAVFPEALQFYLDIHEHPELSSEEVQTAAKLARRLRSFGYDVSEGVGGTGVVAVLKNGAGPVVMARTELDALPVEEKTGLPYASKVHAKDPDGKDVPVMHACGHDLHMASLVGTARIMAESRKTWHGTLVLIGQPAEETISGAKRMLDDGFLARFPKPDVGIALHVENLVPAGKVGVRPGFRLTSADSLRITIYGKGGHGSSPHTTVDPILIAARTILSLQTIVSREVKPGEVAVLTVGYIHAGLKNNIIPDEAQLGLTVRAYKPEVRKQILTSITRIVNAESAAAGAPKPPRIEHPESTDALYNDRVLADRLSAALETALGKENVMFPDPGMASEDYSYFVNAGIPSLAFTLGGADPEKFEKAKAEGTTLPSNHSSLFAPVVEPALRTGIIAEVALLRNLLQGSSADLLKSTESGAKAK